MAKGAVPGCRPCGYAPPEGNGFLSVRDFRKGNVRPARVARINA